MFLNVTASPRNGKIGHSQNTQGSRCNGRNISGDLQAFPPAESANYSKGEMFADSASSRVTHPFVPPSLPPAPMCQGSGMLWLRSHAARGTPVTPLHHPECPLWPSSWLASCRFGEAGGSKWCRRTQDPRLRTQRRKPIWDPPGGKGLEVEGRAWLWEPREVTRRAPFPPGRPGMAREQDKRRLLLLWFPACLFFFTRPPASLEAHHLLLGLGQCPVQFLCLPPSSLPPSS